MNVNKNSNVVIGSAPSSGSTMLVNLLGRSPDLYQTGELSIFDKKDWLASEREITWQKFLYLCHRGYRRRLACEMSSHLTNISESEILNVDINRDARYIEHCEWLMSELCAKKGKERWVEKTPANIFTIPDLQSHRPNWKYVVIYRDPRSALLSLSRRGYSAAMAAARWYLPNLISYNLITSQRVISVRYEDLVNDVHGSLAYLGGELGIDGLELRVLDEKLDSFAFQTWQASPSGPPVKSALWNDEKRLPEGYLEALALIRPSRDFVHVHNLKHVMDAKELAEKLKYSFEWPNVAAAKATKRKSITSDYIRYVAALTRRGYFPRQIPFYFKKC